jgi:TolA-binding protein
MGLVHKEQITLRRNEFLQATANPVDMQIVGMEGRAYLLREVASSLQLDTSKIVKEPERIKFEAEKMQAMQEQQQMMQMQMQQQEQLPAPSGAVTVDEAGNPDGGVYANTMNGAMQ